MLFISKKIKILIIFIFSCFIFTGCWDKFEPEERGYVTAIGIDKNELSEFNVSIELPDLEFLNNSEKASNSPLENENPFIETYSDKSVWSAIKNIDNNTDRKLDFGQVKLCILGENLLKDREMTKQAIDALERNKDIWRKVIVCTTKHTTETILKSYTGDKKTAGFFVSSFFNNNKKSIGSTFKKDLQELLSEISKNKNTALPVIDVNEGELIFSGMSVINNYTVVGYCDSDFIQGYNLIIENIPETIILTNYNGINVPLKISKKNTDISFSEKNNKIDCLISIKIEGIIEEYNGTNVPVSELKKSYEKTIYDKIENCFYEFKNNLNTDILELSEKCRKLNNDLYNKYDKDNSFLNMELSQNIEVIIKGTGTID